MGIGLGISLWSNQAAVSGGGASTTIFNSATSSAHWVLSNGNLTGTTNASALYYLLRANKAKTSGNFTITIPSYAESSVDIGLDDGTTGTDDATHIHDQPKTVVLSVYAGNIYKGGVLVGAFGSGYADGDQIKVANASGMVSFYHNGTLLTTVDATAIGTSLYPVVGADVSGQVVNADFTNWP